MKAIIEIPDDMIRMAGSAICQSHPHLVDLVITAVESLAGKKEIVLRFDKETDRHNMETNTAFLAITQVMEDIDYTLQTIHN